MDNERKIDALLEQASTAPDTLEKISYLEEVLRIDPLHVEALIRMSACYASLSRNRECLDFARRALYINPAKTNAWRLLEHALVGLGIKDKTLKREIATDQLAWCDNYLTKYPNWVQAWYWKTASLAFLGRNQEALTALGSAIKIAPDNAELIFLLGCVLFDLGRKKESVKALARAQELGNSEAAEKIKQVMGTMDSASRKEIAGESQVGVGSTTNMETAELRNEAIKKMKACFIATAACGSPCAPDVITLREYRDRIMSRTRHGALFIRLYEFTSPPLANWIRGRPRFGALVARLIIAPLAQRAGKKLTPDE